MLDNDQKHRAMALLQERQRLTRSHLFDKLTLAERKRIMTHRMLQAIQEERGPTIPTPTPATALATTRSRSRSRSRARSLSPSSFVSSSSHSSSSSTGSDGTEHSESNTDSETDSSSNSDNALGLLSSSYDPPKQSAPPQTSWEFFECGEVTFTPTQARRKDDSDNSGCTVDDRDVDRDLLPVQDVATSESDRPEAQVTFECIDLPIVSARTKWVNTGDRGGRGEEVACTTGGGGDNNSNSNNRKPKLASVQAESQRVLECVEIPMSDAQAQRMDEYFASDEYLDTVSNYFVEPGNIDPDQCLPPEESLREPTSASMASGSGGGKSYGRGGGKSLDSYSKRKQSPSSRSTLTAPKKSRFASITRAVPKDAAIVGASTRATKSNVTSTRVTKSNGTSTRATNSNGTRVGTEIKLNDLITIHRVRNSMTPRIPNNCRVLTAQTRAPGHLLRPLQSSGEGPQRGLVELAPGGSARPWTMLERMAVVGAIETYHLHGEWDQVYRKLASDHLRRSPEEIQVEYERWRTARDSTGPLRGTSLSSLPQPAALGSKPASSRVCGSKNFFETKAQNPSLVSRPVHERIAVNIDHDREYDSVAAVVGPNVPISRAGSGNSSLSQKVPKMPSWPHVPSQPPSEGPNDRMEKSVNAFKGLPSFAAPSYISNMTCVLSASGSSSTGAGVESLSQAFFGRANGQGRAYALGPGGGSGGDSISGTGAHGVQPLDPWRQKEPMMHFDAILNDECLDDCEEEEERLKRRGRAGQTDPDKPKDHRLGSATAAAAAAAFNRLKRLEMGR